MLMIGIILSERLSHFPKVSGCPSLRDSLLEAEDLCEIVWSGTAAASVCGKRSRVAHGIWSLLVLSALADSSEGFNGIHCKPSLSILLPSGYDKFMCHC